MCRPEALRGFAKEGCFRMRPPRDNEDDQWARDRAPESAVLGARGRRTRRARRKACLVLIGDRVRRLREGSQVSRWELARRCRMYRLELKDVEDGLCDVSVLTRDRSAEALGVTLGELVGGKAKAET